MTIAVAEAWAAGKRRVLIVAATGAGKTLLAAELIRVLHARGRRCLFVVHRDVLVGQTAEKLVAFGIPHGYIKAGYAEDKTALVQVASVQTLERRDWWMRQTHSAEDAPPPVVFFDEAHVTAFAHISQTLLAAHPETRAVGLTATPWRLSPREDMGDVFDAAVCAPFPAELIADGHLVPPVYYGTKLPPDLSGVHTRGGEFVEEELLEACDRPELIAAIAEEWRTLAAGQRTLVFCTGVAHARDMAAHFARMGVRAASVDGETPTLVRTRLYAALRRGELQVLASCQVLQEGFDVPEVSCVILARPTKSRGLYMQQLGRGLRIAPWEGKQTCTILDQAGNVGRFGFVQDFAHFELRKGRTDGVRETPAAPPIKMCPACRCLVPTGTRQCPECGYAWPLPRDRRPPMAVQSLRKIERPDLRTESTADRAAHYLDLLQTARTRGYKLSWATMRYKDLFGQWPPTAWQP